MPRIRYTRPRPVRGRRPVPRAFGLPKYKPPKRPVPRADLSKYNAARRAGYKPKPYKPPTLNTQPLERMQAAYNRQRDYRQGRAPVVRYTGDTQARATYQPSTQPKFDKYGRPLKDIDPALYAKIMASKPQDLSGAFDKSDFYQGEDFVNYLMDEGIVPHWGNVRAPSGKWVDYLLTKMGITSYGVNPFAKPSPQQQEPSYAGGGDYAGGGGGGGGGYTPPEPKQYGSIRDRGGYNPPDWLQQMSVWNI